MNDLSAGAFAIIYGERDEVLLCLREDLGIWNLPGGRVDRGESPWKAVEREVEEETGLLVEVERLAGVYWRPRESEVAFSFVCYVVGGGIVKTWEAVEAKYFTIEEVPERSNHRHIELIRDALDRAGETVLKVQDGLSARELVERGLL